MAFVSGTASSMAELATLIASACVANGWSQESNILYKGDQFVRITTTSTEVIFTAGTGQAAGVLSGAAPTVRMLSTSNMRVWTFPVNYEVHVLTSPDEVYVVVNHDTSKFQHAFWGKSTVPDVGGTGMWISATCGASIGSSGYQSFGGTDYNFGGNNAAGFAAFGVRSSDTGRRNTFSHNAVDGSAGWKSFPFALGNIWPLLDIQPNVWNDETILLPMPATIPWSAGAKVSLIAQPAYLRSCRITYHNPFEIVTIAGVPWRLYPWRQKNTSAPNGTANQDHSGTWGFAVRYTGP